MPLVSPEELERLWKRRLLTLPEGSLVELCRNYLVEVRTPYNSHQLVQRLEAWWHQGRVQLAMRASLSDRDCMILSALQSMPGQSGADLAGLTGLSNQLELELALLNLEDRLLAFRSPDRRDNLWYPTSLALEVARPWLGLHWLVQKADRLQTTPTVLADDALFLSVLLVAGDQAEPALTRGGEVRKRLIEACQQRIRHGHQPPAAELLGLVVGAAYLLGLIRDEDSGLVLSLDRLGDWLDRSQADRQELLWSAALLANQSGPAPHLDTAQKLLHLTINLRAWLTGLAERGGLDADQIQRMWLLVGGEPYPNLVTAAVGLGLLEAAEGRYQVSPVALKPAKEPAGDRSGQVMAQASGRLVLTDVASSGRELLEVLACSTLVRSDLVLELELDRQRTESRLQQIGLDRLLEAFQTACRQGLSDNLSFQIRDWSLQLEQVQVYEGLIVNLDPIRAAILAADGDLGPHLLANPSPGLYVVAAAGRTALQACLNRLGVNLDSRLSPPAESSWLPSLPSLPARAPLSSGLAGGEFGLTLGEGGSLSAQVPDPSSDSGLAAPLLPDPAGGARLRAELLEALSQRRRPERESEILRQRIRDGLILDPLQLDQVLSLPGGQEAGALDYGGKLRIIEQASRSRSDLLDLQIGSPESGILSWVVRPLSLVQGRQGAVLVATNLADGKELSLPVNRLLGVRRLRSSLSGG